MKAHLLLGTSRYSMLFLAFFVASSSGILFGQTHSIRLDVDAASKTVSVESKESIANERIRQMELRIESLLKELDELKSLVSELAAGKEEIENDEEKNIAESGPALSQTGSIARATAPEPDRSKQAQTKDIGVDVGRARLTPYGSIYFNGFSNTDGTNNADVPLFATPTGSSGSGASLRQTRLGLRLEGAKVGNARLNAVLEADFFGGFPSIGIGENFGIVRLRLANVRLDWEKTSVTIGQDWSVFAPLSPNSLAAAAIPQMASAGNNWARLPQIKVDTKIGKYLRWQGAVTAPQTGDSATNAAFLLQPNSGSASKIPFFQSRLAVSDSNLFGTKKPGHIAISGHYGRSRIRSGIAGIVNDINSAGVAIDWNLPLHERVGLTGEAFYGQNLAGFQSGIFQGYNTDFAYQQGMIIVPGSVRAIRTGGGWVQIGLTPPVAGDRISVFGSIGIDDPNNADLVTFVPRDMRSRNVAFAVNSIYRFTPQFSIGAEYRHYYTHWTLSRRQTAGHVNLGAVYTF